MSKHSINREEIISVENLDKNMFVEAGAGAGKTTLIVKRVIEQLKNGATPDSIVVITFTNKAANELLDRIIKEITESIRPESKEPDDAKIILRKALESIEDMNISTIHSFCYKLLRENAFAAEIPVGTILVDPSEQVVLEEQYFNAFVETFTKEDWKKLYDVSKYGRFRTNSIIKEIYTDICGLQKDIEIKCPKPIKSRDILAQENKELVDSFLELFDNCAKAIDPDYAGLGTEKFVLSDKSKFYGLFASGDRNDDKIIKYFKDKYVKDGVIDANIFKNGSKIIADTRKLQAEINKYVAEAYMSSKSIDDLKNAIVECLNRVLVERKINDFSEVKKDGMEVEACIVDRAFELVDELQAYDPATGINEILKKKLKNIESGYAKNGSYKFFGSSFLKVPAFDEGTIALQNIAVEEWVNEHCELIEENVDLAYEEFYQLCVDYAIKAREFYWKNRPANMICNDDLLNYTYDMCNSNGDVLDRLSKKYTCFYVDEFQDTDRIQASFIWKLASKSDNSKKLRDGALFVVGDPKQSIYRFRGAEPEVFFKIKEDMKALDNAIIFNLRENHRSNDMIIRWVNNCYKRLEMESKSGIDGLPIPLISDPGFTYEEMMHVKGLTGESLIQDGGKVLAGIYHINRGDGYRIEEDKPTTNAPSNDDRKSDDDLAKELAKLIANLTDVKNGFKITRYEKEIGEDNKIKFLPYTDQVIYSDILVICPTMVKMDIYIKALADKGIPVRFDGNMKPSDFTELKAFARIFRFLSNKKDKAARVGAIEAIWKCAFFSDEEEAFEKGGILLDALSDDTYQMNGYAAAYELLNKLSLLANKVSENKTNSEKRLNDVKSIRTKLEQMVESVVSSCNGTMVEMADAFEDYLAASVEHELSLEHNPNAVRFMNLHKAKGLEGNIVILVDRRKRINPSFEGGIINGIYYPASGKTWNAIKGTPREKEYLRECYCESRRLEYVFATRAEQALIFTDISEVGNLFADSDFIYGIDDNPDMTVKDILELPDNTRPADIVAYDYDSEKHIQGIFTESNSKETEARLSPSRFEKYESAEKDKEIKVEEAAMARPKGKDFGKRMHKMLELLISRWSDKTSGISSSELVHICAVQAVGAELDNADYDVVLASETPFLEKIGEAVVANLESTDSILKDAKEIYTELPFSYSFVQRNDDGSDIPAWMNGEADLVIKKKDGSILLIDYKSDSDEMSHEDAFIEHLTVTYTPQIEEYKKALTRIFSGITVESISSMLISFSQKDESGKFYSEPKIRMRFTPLD